MLNSAEFGIGQKVECYIGQELRDYEQGDHVAMVNVEFHGIW